MVERSDAVEVIQGLRAGLAAILRRGDDVVQIAYLPALRKELADAIRWAASRRTPCHEAEESWLSRLSRSTHHEGLCVVVRPRKWLAPNEFGDALARDQAVAIALDRIRNPYNVGAILRSAAFFGVHGALFGALAPQPDLPPIAVRVAEGGVEHLLLARTTDLPNTLARLRARGVTVVGADGHAPLPLARLSVGRPAILVMGNEREGIGDRVQAQCDVLVRIPGRGAVESLNVAVAAGILLQSLQRDANDVA